MKLAAVLQTPVEEIVSDGLAVEEILSMSHQWEARLILVGSHQRRGISPYYSCSVSMAVAAHAHCPVLVIRNFPPQDASKESASGTAKLAPVSILSNPGLVTSTSPGQASGSK